MEHLHSDQKPQGTVEEDAENLGNLEDGNAIAGHGLAVVPMNSLQLWLSVKRPTQDQG